MLALVAAFWTQVDYRLRQLQPWKELRTKAQPAEDGLLLDYISPIPLMAFFTSLRKCHWSVSAGLLGSFLLKILIVISTGLFSLQTVPVPLSVPFSMTEQFQVHDVSPATVDDVAAAAYAGVFFEGLSYTSGTNSRFAVEMFNTSHNIKGMGARLYLIGLMCPQQRAIT